MIQRLLSFLEVGWAKFCISLAVRHQGLMFLWPQVRLFHLFRKSCRESSKPFLPNTDLDYHSTKEVLKPIFRLYQPKFSPFLII